jgi:epoxyqueuosine reductase
MIGKQRLRALALECGFELAGVAGVGPLGDYPRYQAWAASGAAGAMRYLTDHRAALREDPRRLLESARSVIVVGKLYKTAHPGGRAISRYAWGTDYHDVLRQGLEELARRLGQELGAGFDWRAAVDTAPLLERSLARQAGLGWIGKNTCLIHQQSGSWYFLGELLTSLEIEPDFPAPARCGTCTRCIDACPTGALDRGGLDARRCISYLTVELRGDIPEELHGGIGGHAFGCDICQEVCPWNRRAPHTEDERFFPQIPLELEELARVTEESFRALFRRTPVWRAKYAGFQRNLTIAIQNSESVR